MRNRKFKLNKLKNRVIKKFNNWIVPSLIFLCIPLINLIISIIYINEITNSWWFAFMLTVLSCDIGALISNKLNLRDMSLEKIQSVRAFKIILLLFSIVVYTVSYTIFGLRKFGTNATYIFTLIATIITTLVCIGLNIYQNSYDKKMIKKLNKQDEKFKTKIETAQQTLKMGKDKIDVEGK